MLGVSGELYYGEVENGEGSIPIPLGGGEEPPPVFSQMGEFQKIHSVLVDGGDRFGVSSVAIDQQEELIWMGNQGGHVTSYYGSNMEKYTSFQVVNNQEIRQILTFDDFILILSQTQLRGQIRRGLPVFTHVSENLQEMQCMLQTSPTTVLLGGHQECLVEYDLQQTTELRTIQMGVSGCAILRNHGRYICAGEPTGQIHLLDSRTFRKEQSLEAHSGSLSDFDVHGNLVVTCGFSSRHGTLNVDRFLKVYDLRVLRALAPIPVSIDPFLLRFLPSFSSRIATVSPSGQMEVLETQALSTANIMLYQVTSNTSLCQSFDVSTSCHHMAFGDSAGSLHLFSSTPTAMFNSFSRTTEFPDPVEQFPPMGFADDVSCLASIPLPLVNAPLLSDWPAHLIRPAYRKMPEVDRQILQSMKMVGTIGYAPNPGTFRRNQVQYKFDSPMGPKTSPNSSLSPSTTGSQNSHSPNISNLTSIKPFAHHSHSHHVSNHSLMSRSGTFGMKHHLHHTRSFGSSGRFQIPKRYARIEWKKNFFEETDMDAFNRTQFAGLEATTANSYCNSMLQILYHIDYLRGSLLSHLCKKDACLSCELGFLFHMLDQSKSIPCLGSNFLRAFRVVPEASALGLILQESQSKQRSTFLRLIQSWNRFILHQIETETGKIEGNSDSVGSAGYEHTNSDPISKLFAMRQENMNRCTRCGREEKKESTVLLSNLLYSPDATGGGKRCKFLDILQRSLCPEQTTPAWCDQCEKYQPTFQSRVPKALPAILSLNTCLDNAHDFQTWKHGLESLLPEKLCKSDSGLAETPVNIPAQMMMPGPHMKSCRYGRNCMRPDCKFWHEGRVNKEGENVKMTEFELNPEVQVKWLPSDVRIQIEDSRRVRIESADLETIYPQPMSVDKIIQGLAADYQLMAVICFVKDPDTEEKNNLVAIINVDSPYMERTGQPQSKTGWFIFNDFCVKEVPMTEAYSFNPKWKIPCVVYYRKVQLPAELQKSPTVKRTITVDVFKEVKGKEMGKNKKVTYKPLEPEEIPQKGQLVAMDAEFVTLGQEETELRSDGKLATVKPQQLTVGRVTCIRGQGSLEGTPFLDDYIATQEVVVDYLTKFSGIQPGDLDVNFSSKNITILKSVYLKLRFLIDSGVLFVGHGLNNDFRVINLVVPPEQVVDTVTLFYLPNQRMISLRFLAWHFLEMVIQSDMHDSAEDARAALFLYRKYEELKQTGKLEKALDDLYEAGKKVQWKVPNAGDK